MEPIEIIDTSKSEIKIHKDHLEDDWENHSELALKWHILLAQAIRDRDDVKDRLMKQEAELASQIRTDPKSHGLDKITEGGINEIVRFDSDMTELRTNVIFLDFKVNLLKGITVSFDHRKKALEEEVSLYIAGYFSPKLKPSLRPNIDTQVAALNKRKE